MFAPFSQIHFYLHGSNLSRVFRWKVSRRLASQHPRPQCRHLPYLCECDVNELEENKNNCQCHYGTTKRWFTNSTCKKSWYNYSVISAVIIIRLLTTNHHSFSLLPGILPDAVKSLTTSVLGNLKSDLDFAIRSSQCKLPRSRAGSPGRLRVQNFLRSEGVEHVNKEARPS